MQHDPEFVFSLLLQETVLTDGQVNIILYGGVISFLLIIAIWSLFLYIKNGKRIKKNSIVKELYNEKERKNGQHKGGARGSF